eukprot:12844255-Alexandrium_andersonii.AAC.1
MLVRAGKQLCRNPTCSRNLASPEACASSPWILGAASALVPPATSSPSLPSARRCTASAQRALSPAAIPGDSRPACASVAGILSQGSRAYGIGTTSH